MKNSIHYLLPFFISFAILASRCGPPAPVEEAVANLEGLHRALEAFNQAYARADAAALDGMLTAGYLHTNGANPALDKDKWLQYIASRRKALDAGRLSIDHYSLFGLKTRLYGPAAAVSARVRTGGLDENGPFEHEFQVTQLWVFEPEGWKRAAYHDGQVK